jgi:hypothetical protein
MPRTTDAPLSAPVLVRLYEEDLAYLKAYYGTNFGVNKALRTIVRSFCNHTRAEAAKRIDAQSAPKIDVNLEAAP